MNKVRGNEYCHGLVDNDNDNDNVKEKGKKGFKVLHVKSTWQPCHLVGKVN